ncbi:MULTISPECIES: phosphopantetheine-binding protein [Paenibacillus]|uniref:phosphopantetheine-binding protein n=1 Tax=Paenibacillus TaxID=44249 RepID=UPI000FB80C04|nr:phosphopantetheine-binding protein [Paenibacillus sp. EKM211P]KAF6582687.1 acyl carrier protein [Paenibacillus sp. EKM211P]MEE4562229.1 phosphopantetheine-binding protein [Paenibacillus polymyxa]
MEIRKKVIKLITDNLETENVKKNVINEDDLSQMGINSIVFIQLVVALENEFGIEFEVEALDYKKFTSLDLICSYIEQKLKNN